MFQVVVNEIHYEVMIYSLGDTIFPNFPRHPQFYDAGNSFTLIFAGCYDVFCGVYVTVLYAPQCHYHIQSSGRRGCSQS